MTALAEIPPVTCGQCKAPLPSGLFNQTEPGECPGCGAVTRVLVFPALTRREPSAARPESLLGDGEAGCYFHATKKAVVTCANCGRFLCALCDLELDGRHLCPGCLESGKQKGRLVGLDTQRTVHASVALGLALVSMLIGPLALITAPVVLFLVVRHWKSPGSLVGRRGRVRLVAAAVLAGVQLLGWLTWIVALFL